jgi:hypothetical protein
MWKTGEKPCAARLFAVEENVEKKCAFHRQKEHRNFPQSLLHNPQKVVET